MNCSTGEKQSVEVEDCSTFNSCCESYSYGDDKSKKEKMLSMYTLKFDCQITNS